MKGKQLYEALKLSPDVQGAREAALLYLEETASDSDGFKHIYDLKTGHWQQQFTANGNEYRILSPSEGVGLKRYQMLRTSIEVVGADMSLTDQMRMVNEAKKVMDEIAASKTGFVRLSVILENMSQGIARSSRNWPLSAYAATLFIVRKGEDLENYDSDLAEEKIADWAAEKIHEADFFFCCWQWEKRWNEKLSAFAVRLT